MTESITKRIDRVTLITDDRRSTKPPAPRSVKIELTPRCQYRCGFCALRTRKVQPKHDMDFSLFQRVTTEMREAGVEEIGCFYLGEPFMNHELLVDAIRWCKKDLNFPYVFVTSNAAMATPERVEACMKAGLDSLKWSMNAADEEQFVDVMDVSPKHFRRALANVRAAWEVRQRGDYRCGLYASSIRYDGEQQAKMEALLDEHVRPFVDETYWLPLYSMGSLATQREEELGYRPTAGNQGRLGALREPLPCWSLWEGHVTADGFLSACCFDADANWTMADLKEVSFMDGWHSEKFQALRAAHLKRDVTGTVCQDCVAYRG